MVDPRTYVKTAEEIAKKLAARGMNILIIGPQMATTMIARRIRDAMPPMLASEQADVLDMYTRARIGYSTAPSRPFRAPHYTISAAALRGTQQPKNAKYRPGEYLPGEVDLANHGVLLLDQLGEFSRLCIEAIGESKRIVTTIVIATTMRCPCGKTSCKCDRAARERYMVRVADYCQKIGILATVRLDQGGEVEVGGMNGLESADRDDVEVAETIIAQLGGKGKMYAMIGVKDYFAITNGVSIRWTARAKHGENHVQITLRPDDTYDVEFYKIDRYESRSLKRYEGVYADDLKRIFEEQTGLRLSL
jgi:hypothetical protein